MPSGVSFALNLFRCPNQIHFVSVLSQLRIHSRHVILRGDLLGHYEMKSSTEQACVRECVFVSVSVYARVKFRIVLSFIRVKQGMQHVMKKKD